MSDKLDKYIAKKRLMTTDLVRNARRHTFCYLFLLPYAILFITFYVLPMLTSMYFSFTNYNILEKPDFIGVRNYINLFLEDEVFTIAVKNTFVIALIIGPVGYIMAFIFAWLINELPNWIRTLVVFFFYVPSISGQAFNVFKFFFSDDANGWINAKLIPFRLYFSGEIHAIFNIIVMCRDSNHLNAVTRIWTKLLDIVITSHSHARKHRVSCIFRN